MHIELAGPTGAAHSQILQRTAEPREIVPFEMRNDQQRICMNDVGGQLGSLHQFTFYRYLYRVFAAQSVGNNHRHLQTSVVESVERRAMQVIHRVPTHARIQGIGVGKIRFALDLAQSFQYGPQINRPNEGRIAIFTHMDFYRHKLIFMI